MSREVPPLPSISRPSSGSMFNIEWFGPGKNVGTLTSLSFAPLARLTPQGEDAPEAAVAGVPGGAVGCGALDDIYFCRAGSRVGQPAEVREIVITNFEMPKLGFGCSYIRYISRYSYYV